MPGFNPDKINIHELAIEEPEKQAELPFDPERDITEKDWKGIKNELESIRKTGNFVKFADHATEMKILDSNIDLGIEQPSPFGHETIWQGIQSILKGLATEEQPNWILMSEMAMKMKIINPKAGHNIDETSWLIMGSELGLLREGCSWAGFSRIAGSMKIVDPSFNLNIDQSVREGISSELDRAKKMGLWDFYFKYAAMARIIDADIDLGLNETAWQAMRERLEKRRGVNNYYNFAEVAANMKILAAEKVEVTDKGLEITMPIKKIKSNVPEMPEARSF